MEEESPLDESPQVAASPCESLAPPGQAAENGGSSEEAAVEAVEEVPPPETTPAVLSPGEKAAAPKVLFEMPLMSSIVYTTEEGSKLELSQLEKESLDAAFEIESSQEAELVSSIPAEGQILEEHQHMEPSSKEVEGQILEEEASSKEVEERILEEEPTSKEEDEEVINETSSEENDDEDVDNPRRGSLPVLNEDDAEKGQEEFNTLWKTLHAEESPETAIMEEVEDEFLKDLESDLGEIPTLQPKPHEEPPKDDEDISKIAAFINETASPSEKKKESAAAKVAKTKQKKRVKIKLSKQNGGKVPKRGVGRPPKIGGKNMSHRRVGRPPNRPRRKRGRPKKVQDPPTTLQNGSKPEEQKPPPADPPVVDDDEQPMPSSPSPPPPPSLRTYESDWRGILRLRGNDYDKFVDQIFYTSTFPGSIPYNPGGVSNISQRCAESLSPWDLERLQCPACPDSFLIPACFFQHLYRQSCEIVFKCKLCDEVLTLPNRCALKVHFLAHMELDKSLSSVDIDHASLRPPPTLVSSSSHILEPISKELFNRGKSTCPECRLCLEELGPHMREPRGGRPLHCASCPAILPNACSLSAHSRIHEGLGPFVCPECGEAFQTQDVFREHVSDFCLHEHRALLFHCPFRHKGQEERVRLEYGQLLEHVRGHHLRVLYKCAYCSRAFTSEEAIRSHLQAEHAGIPGYLREKESFSLLYKTFISREKRIFCKRESFESAAYSVAEKSWKTSFLFKCPSCKTFFEEVEGLRSHGVRWCRLSTAQAVAPSSLFPPPTSSKSSVKESGENFCKEENCLHCTKIFDLIQNHKQECSTQVNKAPENGTSEPAPPKTHRTHRRALASEGFFNELSAEEEEEEEETEEEPPRKRGRKPKALVETLGLNAPSFKSILHFNRLSKQAMSLGSTVLPKRMRTSLHNCSLCEFKSNDRLSFLAHIKEHASKYEDAYLLQCKECGMSFASEPSWKKHLFLIHRIRNPTPADYQLSSSDVLLDEDSGDMRLVIDEERRPNVCQVCSRAFESPKDLKKHARGHGSAVLQEVRKRTTTHLSSS